MNTAVTVPDKKQRVSLITKFADKYSVDPSKLLVTLKATAFQTEKEISDEQMMALLIVADQYNLNPFTKEIYAFPDKYKGIVPIVSVDGWARIINEHEQMDGVRFSPLKNEAGKVIEVVCEIFRKDRSHPTSIGELMEECWRDTAAWKSHPSRMLRHKSLIQCARIAFGFAGIYDEDEGQRILEAQADRVVHTVPAGASRADTAREAARQAVSPAKDIDLASDPLPKEPVTEKTPVRQGYTVEKACPLLRAATSRKVLDTVFGLISDDYAFSDTDIPPEIDECYKQCVEKLGD